MHILLTRTPRLGKGGGPAPSGMGAGSSHAFPVSPEEGRANHGRTRRLWVGRELSRRQLENTLQTWSLAAAAPVNRASPRETARRLAPAMSPSAPAPVARELTVTSLWTVSWSSWRDGSQGALCGRVERGSWEQTWGPLRVGVREDARRVSSLGGGQGPPRAQRLDPGDRASGWLWLCFNTAFPPCFRLRPFGRTAQLLVGTGRVPGVPGSRRASFREVG